MDHHFEYINYLKSKGGPNVEDYYDLDAWVAEVAELTASGQLSKSDRNTLIELFEDAFSTETMQGFAFSKPHGYAGDYEIIERIYNKYLSKNPALTNWDVYWQSHAAPGAVRNRLHYLNRSIVSRIPSRADEPFHVLNIASGPGRDMLYFYENNPNLDVNIDCIEQDPNAVNHAKSLCERYLPNIHFIITNALRFRTHKQYQLVWSAGLFDYFSDKVFVSMLRKLRSMVADGGEIVIGNFSTSNPTKPYMELFEWHLNHRSPITLKALATQAGYDEKLIRIEKEELGVNLFLHIGPLSRVIP